MFAKDSHGFHCQQVIPFDNKGQLKEAFNIRYHWIFLQDCEDSLSAMSS